MGAQVRHALRAIMDTPTARIMQAYERMATEAKYRPAAPGDGLGGIYLDPDQLADDGILHAEARKYADHFHKEEDKREFWIGCSCFSTVRAFVYTIEAARCLCAGCDFEDVARKLLWMAADEIKQEDKRDERRQFV